MLERRGNSKRPVCPVFYSKNEENIFYPGNSSDVTMKWTEGYEDVSSATSILQDTRDPLLQPNRMRNFTGPCPKLQPFCCLLPRHPTRDLMLHVRGMWEPCERSTCSQGGCRCGSALRGSPAALVPVVVPFLHFTVAASYSRDFSLSSQSLSLPN